ncbi:T9SS type A sorting domain-containing protein [Pontibacter sp. HSC-36F09]|uniref:T9SS type A sorting domain-containing protein n=1 Tax=Pontibacter sp. HSC-36F09 TaxID=2910966 RepID=UPI00209D9CDF|nr:T9SS type A sorting domain-containing protein [Pontibacter sp. HSC-36F09]MCP2043020.1 hypothetical protein [Pontibacter sp. HSC-36F09]
MKHIYNPTAALIQRPTANATGTAVASKIFMLLLLSFFLLVSGESVGQVISMNELERGNITKGSFSLSNSQWAIIADNGNAGNHGYAGNLLIKKGTLDRVFELEAGNTYTILIRARAVKNPGSISLMRSQTPTGAGISLGSPITIDVSVDYREYTATFSVPTTLPNQYLRLSVSNDLNNSELYINSLIISACTLPPSVANVASCNSPANLTLTASGATSGESYRWYIQEEGGTPITAPNGNVITTETYTPQQPLRETWTFYVTRINNATLCESPRVPIVATVGRPNTPTLISSGTCQTKNGDDVTFTASGANTNEEYRWYTSATGAQPIAGVTNDTYVIKANQFQQIYVEIINPNNLTCRSVRVGLNKTEISNSPIAPNVSRCGPGELILTATGAGDGQTYRWYMNNSLIGQGLTHLVNLNANSSVTYQVSIASALCEGPRVNITASSTGSPLAPTGQIAEQDVMVIGSRATFQVVLSNIPEGEIESYEWFKQEVKSTEWIPFSGSNMRSFTIEEMPGNIDGMRVDIKIKPEYRSCYLNLEGTNNDIYRITNLAIIPLPVELMFFKAQAQTKGVNLTWATASELENKGFEVQVSNNARDFKAIGFVESKVGTTSHTQHYNFLDTKAVSGTRYYRLKQIDFDGTTSFSPIRAVALNADNATVSAYPNPFDDAVIVTLNGTEARNVQVVLMDAMGKVLQQHTEETSGNSITVDMRSITTKGMYVLHVLDNDTKHTFKLMKR